MTDYAVNFGAGNVSGQAGNYRPNQTSSTPQTGLNKYDELTIWQAANQAAIEENVLQTLEQGEFETQEEYNEAFESAYDTAIDCATDFSFTEEGKSYGEQLETLTQAHITAYDTIETDGKITFDEYKEREKLEYNTFFSEEGSEITEFDEATTQMLQTSFDFMDLNGDSAIDADEIKTYYITADIMDSVENPPENPQDMMDGNIKFSSCAAMGDTMSMEGEEGSEQAVNRTNLRNSMQEIYNNNKTEEVPQETPAETPAENPEEKVEENPEKSDEDNYDATENTTPKAYEPFDFIAEKPTTKGLMISAAEDKILNENPFKNI